MRGLRTQEGKKFESFFSIVQNAAMEADCIFFLDAGDGREVETEDMSGEDLMGWLIPEKEADKFEEKWEKRESVDHWSDRFCWAVWDDTNGIRIKFEFY